MKLSFTPKSMMVKIISKIFLIFSFVLASSLCVKAQVIYAISTSGNLVSFNPTAPGTILTSFPLSGITAGQVIEGLDFRPATGQLYALGYKASTGESQLYLIQTPSGVATTVGTPLTLAAGMTDLSFDFNPTVDRIRVASRTRQNYRLNPNDGTLTATDGTLAYAPAPEPYTASVPQVVTVAYTNNYAGATTTTLYDYDFALNIIGTINPPNNGTINSIGTSSGGGANNTIGLDIDITTNPATLVNTAYFTADITSTGTANSLFILNLSTGSAAFVGTIGGGKITEMAISIPFVSLPVILVDFAAKKSGLNTEVSWSTKTELNSNYFVVERSADGVTFTPVSDKINSKGIDGTSVTSLNYSFTDINTLSGTNYYRIVQVDKDGNTKYSQVVTVTFDGKNVFKAYPNPAKAVLFINGNFSKNTNFQVKLTDASGKTVLANSYRNINGIWNTQLNVNGLQTGMYYLQISDGKNVLHTQSVYKD